MSDEWKVRKVKRRNYFGLITFFCTFASGFRVSPVIQTSKDGPVA